MKAFQQLKGLRRDPLTITNHRRMIVCFDEAGIFTAKLGQSRKPGT